MIINETLDLLRLHHNNIFKSATIENVVVGLFFTGVKLSSGYCGIAKTEINSALAGSNYRVKDFSAFSPGKIKGQKIIDLFNYKGNSIPIESVKLAVLNAISAEITANSNYHIIEDKDPIDLIDLDGKKTICIVGAFQSYINKISATSNKLLVLELNENALSEEQKKYYVPPSQSANAFFQSDIIIITGSTLANNTADNLLNLIPSHKQIILVGPTSSLIPDVIFKYNVDIIGSIKILNAGKMFEIISEAGVGYHMFEKACAKKICLINDEKKTNK